MKAALNGGLNLSILDGWWDEWYDGNNGWSIPSADGVDDADHRDDIEATALYDLIENEVAPRFYDEDEEGTPIRWIEMVRHTLKSLGPRCSPDRMVRDYVMRLYSPAAHSSRTLNGDYAGAQQFADWKRKVRAGWSSVTIDHVESSGVSDAPEIGTCSRSRAFVSLGELSPDDVDVQVVHGRSGTRTTWPRRRSPHSFSSRPTSRSAPLRGDGRADDVRSVRLHGPGAPEERAHGLAGRAGPDHAPAALRLTAGGARSPSAARCR